MHTVSLDSINMKKAVIFLGLLFIFTACSEKERQTTVIYTPATPSSVPVVIAAQQMPNTEFHVFTNHPKAHSLFLKGDADILFTGLSVGLNFYRKGKKVRIFNSYVTGLTHLITRGRSVKNFSELKGETLIVPFENSPIDELTRFFVESEGLDYGRDIKIQYSLPYAARSLLANEKADNAPLPEPLVTALLNSDNNLKLSFSYREYYMQVTGNKKGYPQVGGFVKGDSAAEKREYLKQFNAELEKAIQLCRENPEDAIMLVKGSFGFDEAVLKKALQRTVFKLESSENLKKEVYDYYNTIRKPLSEESEDFFISLQ